eukprot:gb/GECG01006103.1/.p1 GENE.gb/GECG01006103.1/~~gb/GECG01006103.1/.p1  ORF type:complete len:1370 (+),score=204.25 gb/GECG01006103.1/:1-4110(+)
MPGTKRSRDTNASKNRHKKSQKQASSASSSSLPFPWPSWDGHERLNDENTVQMAAAASSSRRGQGETNPFAIPTALSSGGLTPLRTHNNSSSSSTQGRNVSFPAARAAEDEDTVQDVIFRNPDGSTLGQRTGLTNGAVPRSNGEHTFDLGSDLSATFPFATADDHNTVQEANGLSSSAGDRRAVAEDRRSNKKSSHKSKNTVRDTNRKKSRGRNVPDLSDISEGIQSTKKAEELLQSLRENKKTSSNTPGTIARRTRARQPMRDVDFENIDMVLHDNLDAEDSEDTVDAATKDYKEFLKNIRGPGSSEDANENIDIDDEDFFEEPGTMSEEDNLDNVPRVSQEELLDLLNQAEELFPQQQKNQKKGGRTPNKPTPGAKLQPLESLPCQSVLGKSLQATDTAIEEADTKFFKDHTYLTKDQEYCLNLQVQIHVQLLLQTALISSQHNDTANLLHETECLFDELEELKTRHTQQLMHTDSPDGTMAYWKETARDYSEADSTDSEYEEEDGESLGSGTSEEDNDDGSESRADTEDASAPGGTVNDDEEDDLSILEQLLKQGTNKVCSIFESPLLGVARPAFLFAFGKNRAPQPVQQLTEQLRRKWAKVQEGKCLLPPDSRSGRAWSGTGSLMHRRLSATPHSFTAADLERVSEEASQHMIEETNNPRAPTMESRASPSATVANIGGCGAHLQVNRAQTSFDVTYGPVRFLRDPAPRFWDFGVDERVGPWWTHTGDYSVRVKHPGACIEGITRATLYVLWTYREYLHPALWPALYCKERSWKMGLSAGNPYSTLPSEERLFFLGLLRFGESHTEIHKMLLPTKTPDNLRIRYKNRSVSTSRQQKSNSLLQEFRSVSARGLFNFDHWEAMILAEAALRYTKQAKQAVNIPWSDVSTLLVPYRGPEILRKYAVSFLFRVPRKAKWPVSENAILNRWKKHANQNANSCEKFHDPFSSDPSDPFSMPSHKFRLIKRCFPDLPVVQGPAAFVGSHYFDRLRYPGTYDGVLTRGKAERLVAERKGKYHGMTTVDTLELRPGPCPPSFTTTMSPPDFDAKSYRDGNFPLLDYMQRDERNCERNFDDDVGGTDTDNHQEVSFMQDSNSTAVGPPPLPSVQAFSSYPTALPRNIRCPARLREQLLSQHSAKFMTCVKEFANFPFTTSLPVLIPTETPDYVSRARTGGQRSTDRTSNSERALPRNGRQSATEKSKDIDQTDFEFDKLETSSDDSSFEDETPTWKEAPSPQEREAASALVLSRRGMRLPSSQDRDGAESLLAFREHSDFSNHAQNASTSFVKRTENGKSEKRPTATGPPATTSVEWNSEMDKILLTEFRKGGNNKDTWKSVAEKVKSSVNTTVKPADVSERYQRIVSSFAKAQQ